MSDKLDCRIDQNTSDLSILFVRAVLRAVVSMKESLLLKLSGSRRCRESLTSPRTVSPRVVSQGLVSHLGEQPPRAINAQDFDFGNLSTDSSALL